MVTLQVFNVFLALTSFVLAAFIEARYRAAEMTRLYVSATAASQAKSSFLSMAAHELLTPLTVFTGYLSLLSGGSLGKPPDAWETPINILMQKTREMEKNRQRPAECVSASRSSTRNLGREVIDLRKVVDERCRAGSTRGPSSFVPKSSSTFPTDPVPVEADEDHLGRVMDDLINNAFTYTIRTPRLVIGLSTRSRKAIVEVEDNGVGIQAGRPRAGLRSPLPGRGSASRRARASGLGFTSAASSRRATGAASRSRAASRAKEAFSRWPYPSRAPRRPRSCGRQQAG